MGMKINGPCGTVAEIDVNEIQSISSNAHPMDGEMVYVITMKNGTNFYTIDDPVNLTMKWRADVNQEKAN